MDLKKQFTKDTYLIYEEKI